MSRSISSYTMSIPAGAKLFLSLLDKIHHGHLELVTPAQTRMIFGKAHDATSAILHIHDWRACERILKGGDIGFAEAYAAGWVDSPDLTALLRLALKNESTLEQMLFGGIISRCWYRLRHWLRPNTRKGSKRNIHAHYDIGNDFYRLWLDPSWTYSSAIFAGKMNLSLEEAQQCKYQRIINKLDLAPGSRVLEIGCGWGGFAEYAARQGICVHGLTISQAQLTVARNRIANAGLASLATFELRDYRDVDGTYDAIVSIEMFEAVGERYWQQYFNTVAARLAPQGKALIQTITIDEHYFHRYRSSADFIQQYIFPGGMLPGVSHVEHHAARAGVPSIERYAFGLDYAETLRRWRTQYNQSEDQVAALGFDARFMRIWDMYLAYCEAGFDEERTNVVQFLLQKS